MREGFNPFYVPTPQSHQGPPRIRFSRIEVLHLLGAVAILTLCFAAVRGRHTNSFDLQQLLRIDPYIVLGAFLAVATGFVLHELAHKVVAQRYGHWAEFRAQFPSLLLSLAVALFAGFLFAAPGAVMIQGAVTRRENGLISLVGPGVNFVIALIAFPFGRAINPGDPLPTVMGTIAVVNAGLCVFNLIPAGPLDGRKVWYWNPGVYIASMVAAVTLLVTTFLVLRPI